MFYIKIRGKRLAQRGKKRLGHDVHNMFITMACFVKNEK